MASAGNKSGKHFPLDNLTYDLITMIYEKSKALEACDKYLQDAQGNERIRQSFEKIRKQDEECITELQQHLSYLIGQQSGMASKTASTGGSSSSSGRR
ncbi:MAG TPA: hypothetical protein VNQ79_04365 [Blastocatellia bacterium]|nr:hypothetical protein [Blastocatellia bacterium]